MNHILVFMNPNNLIIYVIIGFTLFCSSLTGGSLDAERQNTNNLMNISNELLVYNDRSAIFGLKRWWDPEYAKQTRIFARLVMMEDAAHLLEAKSSMLEKLTLKGWHGDLADKAYENLYLFLQVENNGDRTVWGRTGKPYVAVAPLAPGQAVRYLISYGNLSSNLFEMMREQQTSGVGYWKPTTEATSWKYLYTSRKKSSLNIFLKDNFSEQMSYSSLSVWLKGFMLNDLNGDVNYLISKSKYPRDRFYQKGRSLPLKFGIGPASDAATWLRAHAKVAQAVARKRREGGKFRKEDFPLPELPGITACWPKHKGEMLYLMVQPFVRGDVNEFGVKWHTYSIPRIHYFVEWAPSILPLGQLEQEEDLELLKKSMQSIYGLNLKTN